MKLKKIPLSEQLVSRLPPLAGVAVVRMDLADHRI